MSVVIPSGKEDGALSNKEVEDPSKATNSIPFVGSGGPSGVAETGLNIACSITSTATILRSLSVW